MMSCNLKSPRSKRRSSMRRSLVDTLGSMPSTSTQQRDASPLTKTLSSAAEEPVTKKLKMDSAGDSLELPISKSYINEKVDKVIIEELQRELDGWTKLLHEVRNKEDNAIDFSDTLKSSDIPTKHYLRNQQIDDLESKFLSSLGVIDALMARIQIIKTSHVQNIERISQRLYENRLKKFVSIDPKTLIRQILELHEPNEK